MTGLARRLARHWILPFIDPRRLASLALLPRYFLELRAYRKRASGDRVALADAYPCLADRSVHTPFDPHYFYQGAWLARELAAIRPSLHVDVGSSVTMLSMLSASTPTVFVDFRPLRSKLDGLLSVGGDIRRLPLRDASVASLSSLHVIEHVGLGRYGDPLDPAGSAQAARELARVVSPGGRLYLSAPVGRARVCFNAHRVFAPEAMTRMLVGLRLVTFSFVDDAGNLHLNDDPRAAAANDYACGMYVFVKDT